MLTLNVLAPVLYCGALVMMLNVCSDDVLASTFLSLSTTSALEVVVLLLLVLYYSALGVAVTMYDNAHRTITGDTTVVPVLHMPNISSTCRMAWCLCCCACSYARHGCHQPAAINWQLMPLYSLSCTTTLARCLKQWLRGSSTMFRSSVRCPSRQDVLLSGCVCEWMSAACGDFCGALRQHDEERAAAHMAFRMSW